MKLGRNEPCHCGSGKKYKHCHWKEDQQARVATSVELEQKQLAEDGLEDLDKESLEGIAAPFEQDDEIDADFEARKEGLRERFDIDDISREAFMAAHNDRYNAFEKADYHDKISLFEQTLNEPLLMDNEMAFEMLDSLYHLSIQQGERERTDIWLDQLQDSLPEVYEAERQFFDGYRVSNLMAKADYAGLEAYVEPLKAMAVRDIDLFYRIADQLAFHGQMSFLLRVMTAAYAGVSESGDIVPWGLDEFVSRIADLHVFTYIDDNQALDNSEAPKNLLGKMAPHVDDIDEEKFETFYYTVAGQRVQAWQAADFKLQSSVGKNNLARLCQEFLAYAHSKGIAFSLADLAREQWLGFLLEQNYKGHPLLFQPQKFDRFLAGLMDFINPQDFKLAASFSLIPVWLDFLLEKNLVSEKEKSTCIKSLQRLRQDLLKIFENRQEDPALYRSIEQFPGLDVR